MPPVITQPQLALEGLPEPVLPDRARVAFGGFVKTDMYDVFGEHNFSLLTDQEKDWMNRGNIAKALFPERSRTTDRPDGLYVDGVLLNAYEYNLAPRSPVALGAASISRTLKDNDVDEEAVRRAERSRVHTLESKVEPLQEHIARLDERRSELIVLERAAAQPGYAHHKPERMRQLISGAWNEFTNMLDVLQVQRSWTQEQRQAAEAALVHHLTTGPQRNRVANWKSMLDLARAYVTSRADIMTRRLKTVTSLIDNYAGAESTESV